MSDNSAVASAAPIKTPSYAWPCLIVSLLCAIAIVFAWMWLPGVTIPTFQGWIDQTNPSYDASLFPNVMGLVPIGALIWVYLFAP